MTFAPFDPLEFKSAKINDAALGALKREISNILSSYVGWYDPFCELIQNSLDAVEDRFAHEKASGNAYEPWIQIRIDLDANSLTVSDNGIGLDQDKFQQFLAPNFSFKGGDKRGHKGVGATYVAYGFNYMRVSTRTPGFEATGRIVGAKNWLRDKSPAANPKVEPDAEVDPAFKNIDRGVSITVRFDEDTHPRKLDWLGATTADQWRQILSVKTGLGAIRQTIPVDVEIVVVSKAVETSSTIENPAYLWLHERAAKKARVREIEQVQDELYKKYGAGRRMPDKYNNLDFIFEVWTAEELGKLLGNSIGDDEREVLERHTPSISVEFGYTAKLWNQFNDSLGIRVGQKVLTSGIQLAANNMPQGETILVPLNRNIGRQNQVHFLIHFDNYSPDMGRKGFVRELTDFAKASTRIITENYLSKFRHLLKANTGVAPDLVRELKISEWKKEMLEHEGKAPLALKSEHFFKPVERISITSAPTREQDVIALFHQLIAGGVIRGIYAMSTNERFTYDGLFRIGFDLDPSLYEYNDETNPLGVPPNVVEGLKGKVTDPRVLEYKYSLDGLVEDFDSQDKNIKDIDLCVVWETGDLYKERYGIVSLLVPENADQRQYHGVTHILVDIETNAKICELIVLEELVDSLNNPAASADEQRRKYE